MTRLFLAGAAAVLVSMSAGAPALSQGFQGGVSVSTGDIDNAPAARKRVKTPTPARQRAKRRGPTYSNKFHCIPSSCPAR